MPPTGTSDVADPSPEREYADLHSTTTEEEDDSSDSSSSSSSSSGDAGQPRYQPPPPKQQHLDGEGEEEEEEDECDEEEERGGSARQADPARNRDDDEFDAKERQARVVLESIACKDEDVEMRMAEYVEVLKDYRMACQSRSMYKEAHLVQQVLRNLRLEEETRHVRGLTEQQMDERRMLEEAHRDEFRAFHRTWNEKIDLFEEQQLEQEIRLLERQNDELEQFHEEMRDFNPRVLRYSRDLIHTRNKQQALARQKNYVRAQEEKRKADEMEMNDLERFQGTRATMYERREYALRRRHQQELLALRMKVESRRLFLERDRKRELDELLQRYINVRRELESQQNIIRTRTGTVLLKHACNQKTDTSGSAALVESANSGAFGPTVQRRQMEVLQQSCGGSEPPRRLMDRSA